METRTIIIENHESKTLVSELTGKSYDVVDVDGHGVIAIINDNNKLLTYYCGEINEDKDNLEFIYGYEKSHGLLKKGEFIMLKELKMAIIDWLSNNEYEWQRVIACHKVFGNYIYDSNGNYLIGGEKVSDFISQADSLLYK